MKNKKKIVLIILMVTLISNVTAISVGDTFFYIKEWTKFFGTDHPRNGEIGGEVTTWFTIIDMYDNKVKISIGREMTPFPEILSLNTIATYEMGKYVFTTIDGWGNTVFGYFSIETGESPKDEKIRLFLDFTRGEWGSSVGRLYGGPCVLTKGPFPWL